MNLESLIPLKVSSALTVNGVPQTDLGFAPGTRARTPSSFQADALGKFLLILSLTGMAAVSVALLNLIILLRNRSRAKAQERAIRVAVGASRKRLALEWALRSGRRFGAAGLWGLLAGFLGRAAISSTWPHALDPAGPGILQSLASPVVGLFVLIVLAASYSAPPELFSATTPGGILNGGERLVGVRCPEGLRLYIPALQIGLSITLISGSGVLLHGTFAAPLASHASEEDPGILRTPVVFHPTESTPPMGPDTWKQAISRLKEVPGVSEVALVTPGAWIGVGPTDLAWTECGACSVGGMWVPFQAPSVQHHVVSADSFRTMGVSVVQGREFAPSDSPDGPMVAVVNTTYARDHFDQEGPIGKTIGLGAARKSWHTVVGVVEDFGVPGIGSARAPRASVYLSALQHPPDRAELLVVSGPEHVVDPDALADAIQATDGLILTEEPGWFRDHLEQAVAAVKWFGRLSFLLGIGTFAISAYGLFAIMEHSISLRTEEIGVRSAVGAGPWRLVGFVLARSARIILVGVFLGLEGSLFLASGLEGVVAGGQGFDLLLFLSAATTFLLLGLLGSLKPARRAASAPPRVAMGGM